MLACFVVNSMIVCILVLMAPSMVISCTHVTRLSARLSISLADKMVTQEVEKPVSLHCCFFRPNKTAQAAEQQTADAQAMEPSMQGLMWDSGAEQEEHQSRASMQQEAGAMPQPKAKKSGRSVPFVGKAASQSINWCFGIISWLLPAM